MTKLELQHYLTGELAKPCALCTNTVFRTIMDPLTQSWLADFEQRRDGLAQLHVHASTAIDGDVYPEVISFFTWVVLKNDLFIPYWIPGAGTLEKAFLNFDETLRRERERLSVPRSMKSDPLHRSRQRARRAGKRAQAP